LGYVAGLRIGRAHSQENWSAAGRGIARGSCAGNADEYRVLLNCGWPPLGRSSDGSPGDALGATHACDGMTATGNQWINRSKSVEARRRARSTHLTPRFST